MLEHGTLLVSSPPTLPLLAQAGSNAALVSFFVYIAGVMFLAWLSSRIIRSKKFLSAYFLGSR